MEDEQNKAPAPTRSRRNFYKILTLSLGIFLLLIIAGYSTIEFTSSSGFCASCHEMTPEADTWKVSSHSQIECKACHIQPGIINYAKAKMNGLVQVYQKVTNSYTAPIQIKDPIPNSVCEECHNMKDTIVTLPGDLVFNHDTHLTKGVACVTCHYGVVHGDIADRNVTFKSDYSKWNETLAKQEMTVNFTEPQMQDCIQCHQEDGVSTACKTCHSTGMKPATHNDPNWISGEHGKLAEQDIQQCNTCHQYMSTSPIPGVQTKSPSQQFLSGSSKNSSISAQDYAKENTFCATCHAIKPASHDSNWINNHGALASKDEQQCLACHSLKAPLTSSTNSNGLATGAVAAPSSTSGAPACSTCHPAMHDGINYKAGHPIDLTGVTAPSARCYTCHDKATCDVCHDPASNTTNSSAQTPQGTLDSALATEQ